jgi:hypothetical protein
MLTSGAEHAARLGVQGYDCSPDSALESVQKVTFDWALAR